MASYSLVLRSAATICYFLNLVETAQICSLALASAQRRITKITTPTSIGYKSLNIRNENKNKKKRRHTELLDESRRPM